MTYQQLDMIADLYIPVMIAFTLTSWGRKILSALKNGTYTTRSLKSLSRLPAIWIITVGIVYGIMFLDNDMKIWGRIDLDYSTHTALALTTVAFLMFLIPPRSPFHILAFWPAATFIAYALLLIYQGYHSLADILSTTVIILPILIAAYHLLHVKERPQERLTSESDRMSDTAQ